MRPLTSDELKLLLERGTVALEDLSVAEIIEALALEVSERRVAEGGFSWTNTRFTSGPLRFAAQAGFHAACGEEKLAEICAEAARDEQYQDHEAIRRSHSWTPADGVWLVTKEGASKERIALLEGAPLAVALARVEEHADAIYRALDDIQGAISGSVRPKVKRDGMRWTVPSKHEIGQRIIRALVEARAAEAGVGEYSPEEAAYFAGTSGALRPDDVVRVWQVSGPCVHTEADDVICDSAEEAGEIAAEAAEQAWDAGEGSPRTPGAAITIRCYEMPRGEYERFLEDNEESE